MKLSTLSNTDAPGRRVTVSLPALMMSLRGSIGILFGCRWGKTGGEFTSAQNKLEYVGRRSDGVETEKREGEWDTDEGLATHASTCSGVG